MASGQCGGFGVPKGARASERRRRAVRGGEGLRRGLQPARTAEKDGSGGSCHTLVSPQGARALLGVG